VFDGPDFAGFLRAVISVDRIEALVAHINTEKDINIEIFDENGMVINYVGENVITRPGLCFRTHKGRFRELVCKSNYGLRCHSQSYK